MEKRNIHGKPVYIFKDHNEGLAAWADIKATHQPELILLTFDHHTDVHEAFIGWAYHANNGDIDNVDTVIEERLRQVDLSDPRSIENAVRHLRNDEQIDAAIRLGIFRLAFCFNNEHQNTRSKEEQHFQDNWTPGAIPREPPFSYQVPKRKIFEIGEICAVDCERMPHTNECLELAANQAIESLMLERLISTANCMASAAAIQDVTKIPYVLDIDLDYFRTKQAASPTNAGVFHELIRNAVAITIATEPDFVRMERLDDVTSSHTLETVLRHLDQALAL